MSLIFSTLKIGLWGMSDQKNNAKQTGIIINKAATREIV